MKALGVGLRSGPECFKVLAMQEIWHTVRCGIHFAVCVPGQNAAIPEIEEINITGSAG